MTTRTPVCAGRPRSVVDQFLRLAVAARRCAERKMEKQTADLALAA
ncbi:hypothetical protein QKB66_10420 [Corynebacterium sp. c25Ua_89]